MIIFFCYNGFEVMAYDGFKKGSEWLHITASGG